ncbi:MAG TPA: ABC transporter ATP-binding protein [Gemmatimonadota bacterium]|nr:ABC transporter ATP-binding protein [Gemmatimonadota bacterium]
MEIRCQEIVRRYPLEGREVLALAGVSCAFRSAELAVVTGKSGSGKTTLLNIVGGLERPSAGEVTVDGESLYARSDRALSRYRNEHVGFVFQSFHLSAAETALENVLVPYLFARRRPRDRGARARAALADVGLAEQVDQPTGTLSAGQKQRVAIARALVTGPDFVLADEPTGNLDAATGEGIIRLLRAAVDDRGLGVVIVTHDPAITAVADRVLHLVDGRLADPGTA